MVNLHGQTDAPCRPNHEGPPQSALVLQPKKCQFYICELDFLVHHISKWGIEPNSSKIEKILHCPIPQSTSDVHAFLGLVQYIMDFLPKLVDFTVLLTLLMTKEAKRCFPIWTDVHQTAFDAIKLLVVSTECLTTIDHENPCDNKFFVTCDASDWHTGATISFCPTWETAHLVAFDSMQLKIKKNYPIHEKGTSCNNLCPKKRYSDLLVMQFYVYTDHHMLENFNAQKDLSRQQLQGQEFLSQYDFSITSSLEAERPQTRW